MRYLNSSYEAVSEKQIAETEERIGFRFPELYRRFLSLENGGIGYLKENDEAYCFFAIASCPNNISEWWYESRGEIPDHVIQIAQDGNSDPVFMSLKDGKILEKENSIFDDFEAFIDRFKPSREWIEPADRGNG